VVSHFSHSSVFDAVRTEAADAVWTAGTNFLSASSSVYSKGVQDPLCGVQSSQILTTFRIWIGYRSHCN